MGSAEKKGTIKAILIMVFSMLMSRGLGFIRTAVLAGFEGTAGAADAYAFSFLLPDILNQILAGGALSVTFIPLFQSLDGDKAAQNRFFSNIFWIGSALFITAIAITYLFTPQLITLAGGTNVIRPEVFSVTVKLTRIILPAQLFFFWGALLNGAQYAERKFFLPSMAPVLYNLGIILGGVIGNLTGAGIEGFAWGVVAGAFMGNVGVQIWGAQKIGLRLIRHSDRKDPLFKEWLIKTFPLIFSLGLAYSNELMGRIFGSRSPEGTGALASLNYAYRLFMIFVGLFGQAFAAGVYPFISKMANEEKFEEMEKTLFSTLEKTAVFTLSATAIMYAVRYDLVAIAFERGNFSSESTKLTADALSAYLPGMFFFSAVLLLNRLFYALKKTYTTLYIALSVLAITIPIYSTIGIKLGVIGIGLTGSFAAILTFLLQLIQWKKTYPDTKVNSLLGRVVHIGLIAWGAGVIAIGIGKLPLPQEQTFLWRAIRVIVQTLPAMGTALLYFQFRGFLSLKTLLRRGK